jgi:hypothetical protein
MHGLRAFLVMLVTLVFANGALLRVLDSNLQAGIYPTNADSISIPFFESASASVLILLAIGLTVSLPKSRPAWRVVRAISAAFATLLSLAMAATWCSPHHYLAALSFLLVSVACVWSWWQDRGTNKKSGGERVSA